MKRGEFNWKRYDNKKTPFTDEEIDQIIENKYHDCLPNTKTYLREGFKKLGGKFKARYTIIVKEDLIDLVLSKRNDLFSRYKLELLDLPDYTENMNKVKFRLYCHNTICGIEIGELTFSSIKTFLDSLEDPFYNLKEFMDKDFITLDWEDLPYLINQFPEFDFSEVRYAGQNIPIKLRCKSCHNIYWVFPIDICSFLQSGCKICKKEKLKELHRLKQQRKWKLEIEAKFPGKFNLDNIYYIDHDSPVQGIICNNCKKEFSQYPQSTLSGLGVCPECAKKDVGLRGRSNIENVKKVTEERYGPGMFDWSKAIYETNQTPITLIDIESGTEFEITPNHLMFGSGTPISHSRSLGERHVHRWLGEHQNIIEYSSEYYIENISGREGKGSVKIDFRITSINNAQTEIWIECNGLQHYKYDPNYIMFKFYSIEEGKRRFKEGIERDKNVKNYCKEHNIIFLEIPYTYYDYDKIYYLLDEFLIKGNQPIIEIPKIEI